MSRAWLFPGQDAFDPGLAARTGGGAHREVLLTRVRECTGVDVLSAAAWRRAPTWSTAVVQPLLAALCLAEVADHPLPDAVAGASLGGLIAWAVAVRYPAEDVVELAATRGRLMAECAAQHPGGMVVVGNAQVDEALARGQREGVLAVAAWNSPQETILSGDRAALRAVGGLGRPVPVLGPWHSPRMAPAEAAWAEALRGLPARSLACRLVHDGQPLDDTQAREELARLSAPVAWHHTLTRLHADGATHWFTVGPARVLRAQVRASVGHSTQELT